ncbi:S-layer homology domain-containing protein [Paenibacillus sp. FSL H8-0034]|uniref:S-layer homology domain-containing protein n=1 Tax=Paenibacillus sp. FSL H8-0034 TaxID=2954671 RepID=UPI0030F68C24
MFLRNRYSKISGFLVFMLLFGMLVPTWAFGAAAPVELTDISGSYAQKEIRNLVDNGVISGYEDGSFQPAKAMSRAELAKIIVLSLGLKENTDRASAFTDVGKNDWYQGFVGALVESGITQGTSATTFSPNAKVTREELIVFFIRAMGLEEAAGKIAVDANLSDLKQVSSWAQSHVSLAFKIGFVNGIESHDGTLKFSPKDHAERQALARLAYEFNTNKAAYISKGKAFANTGLSDVSSVSVVNNSSVEVTFHKDVITVNETDFTFDNGLNITNAALKTDSKTVVVLTTSVQSTGTVYKLSYRGKDTGLTFTGFAAGDFGGGGGGGGRSAQNSPVIPPSKSDLDKVNSGGTYDSLSITSSGTVGPADGAAKTIVTGTLTLNPGAGGEILLQNVEAANIVVASGSSNSIKLKNTIITTLRVAANNQSEPVRIESLSGSEVTNTNIQSKVIMESSAGSLGMITIGSGAQGQEIELRGTIKGDVTVQGEGAKIKIAAPKDGGTSSIANLNIGTNATISAATGTSLGSLSITAPNTSVTLNGEGEFRSVTVSKEAQGTTLNLSSTSTKISALQLNANIKLEGDAAVIGTIPITVSPGVKVEASPTLINTLKAKAIAAIAAIGSFNSYSAEVDAAITAAETIANNAILLGAAEADITDYSTKLVEYKRLMTTFALEAAYQDLKIGFAGTDTLQAVTQNIVLSTVDALRGVSITWKSSQPSVVSSTGLVTRPALGQADVQVILTALISKNGQVRDVEYPITVLAQRTSVPVEPTVPILDSLSVEPSYVSLKTLGATQPLSIVAKYSDATIHPVTKEASYTSSTPTVASVSKEGIVTAIANGTANITISYGGKTVTVPVIVDVPSGPTDAFGLKPIAGDAQVSLSWNTLGSNVTYQVYSSKTSGSYTQAPTTVTGTTYTVNRLNNGTKYYFIVKATVNGVITASNEVSAIPAVTDSMQKTATPTVTGNAYTNGFKLSGKAELGTLQRTYIMLSRHDGTYLSGSFVEVNGTFTLISNNYDLSLTFSTGEELLLTAQANGKMVSDPVIIVVNALSGQTTMPTVTGIVYDITNLINGYTAPGAFITFKNITNGYISTAIASSIDGYYSLYPYPKLNLGDQLVLTAETVGNKTSNPNYITVIAAPKTATPKVTGNTYTNGFKLSGKVEMEQSNSTYITLTRQDGSYLTGNYVSDGNFTFMSSSYDNEIFSVGEELSLTAQANGKKISDPLKIVVKALSGQTKMPSVTGTVYDLTTVINGFSEQGTTITLKDSSKGYSSTVTTDTYDGSYSLYPYWKYSVGDQLILTAITLGKTTSDPIYITVQDAPKTENPTVIGSVYTNGYMLSGKAELGESNRTSVTLSKKDGTYITQSDVWSDGTFTLQSNSYNRVTLSAGEELILTAKANGKKMSDPLTIVVKGLIGQTTVPTVTGTINDLSYEINGFTELGAFVTLKDSNGYDSTVRAEAHNGSFRFNSYSGRFSIGEQLMLTAEVLGKKVSDPTYVTVQAAPQTETPVVTVNKVYTNGFIVSGRSEPESQYIMTIVTLSKKDGTYITESMAGIDGLFTIKSNIYNNYPALSVGEELQLTARAFGKKMSDPVTIIVNDTIGKTAPIMTDIVNDTIISGWAQFGSLVTIKNEVNGHYSKVNASPTDGFFSAEAGGNTFFLGDQLTITATYIGETISDPIYVTVGASPKTASPTVIGIVYPNAFDIKGTAEPGSAQKLTVLNLVRPNGNYVTSFGVYEDGTFSTSQLYEQWFTRLAVGEELQLIAQAFGKKESDPVKIIVQAVTGQTTVPTLTVVSEAAIRGQAEPGAMISIKMGLNGYSTFTKASMYDGSFSLGMIQTGVLNWGDQLTITATTLGKATSDPVLAIVQASPTTEMPTLAGTVYTNGFMLNGIADSGSTYTYITLNKQNGDYVGSFTTNSDGSFSSSQLTPYVTLTEGELLLLRAQTYDKKQSASVKIIVQATVGQTAVPTILDGAINTNPLSGRAEPGAIITLTNDSRAHTFVATASADGNYTIYWSTDTFKPGDQLSLNATSLGKATSDTVHITLLATP